MHRSILLLCVTIAIIVITCFLKNKIHASKLSSAKGIKHFTGSREALLLRLKKYAATNKSFISDHNYNTAVCFMIDMQLPSGSNRFFVYDLKNDSVITAGLVTHGSGRDFSDQLVFSNKPGSNCSSLGRYKIGASYNGKFGLAYKLYGLDSSNSNAYKRFVVLHSHACVPENEVLPQKICESWGCPTVAPGFLLTLKPYIDKAEKPVLIQIFY